MDKKALLDRFLRYIACASESREERDFCLLLEGELRDLGFEVKRDEAAAQKCGSNGFNLVASSPGQGEPILFSSHLDTVGPGKNIRPVIEGDHIRSSGDTILGGDDKSGIAAILAAFATAKAADKPTRPVELLFTVCEELGLLGSQYADYSLLKSRQGIVLDSGDELGMVISRTPSINHIHVAFHGKASHAGNAPQEGIHALKAAAEAVYRIEVGYVDEMTEVNISNFLAPGKTNVVSDKAEFDMEIRCFEDDRLATHIEGFKRTFDEVAKKTGSTYTLTLERECDPCYVKEDDPLVTSLFSAMRAEGLTPTLISSYGGSDAINLNANGVRALNISTGMQAVHGLSEHIDLRDMLTASNLVYRLLTQ